MQIKIFKDLKKYTLTSSLTKEGIELVKKYRPAALKKKDKDGNDLFAVSYVEGNPCVCSKGVTFGSTANDGGYAMIVGDLPEKLPEGTTYNDYVADLVGGAIADIKVFEETIPEVVATIQSERAELIGSFEEA